LEFGISGTPTSISLQPAGIFFLFREQNDKNRVSTNDMITERYRYWWFGLALILLGFGATSRAAMTNVVVEDFDFAPANVTIKVNDSVRWTWGSGGHSTTSSSPGLWDSGAHVAPFSFTNAFSSAGNFPYFCTVHPFMTASVTVSAANQPPTVAITNPVNGAVFAAPWTGTIRATATDSDGSVTNVEFFNGAASLGHVATPPFNLGVTNLPAGGYSLKAVASDNAGANTASAIVNATVVTPVSILLSDPQRLSGSQFRFTYSANPGLRYAVEKAGVLPNFSSILTNTAAGSSVSFTDVVAGSSQTWYRVRRMPNPD
jgi:plastocyanin